MSWHTFLSLVVFAAFLPSIISEAFPPIPTDPAIRLQTLPRVFDITSQYLTNEAKLLKKLKPFFSLSLGDSTFNGSVQVGKTPVVKIESIENMKQEYPYGGFESTSQTKRDKRSDIKAKAYWYDKKFGTNESIGGLRFHLTDTSLTFDLRDDRNNITVDYANVTFIAEVFIGAFEGKPSFSRIVVEADGDVHIDSDDKPVLLTEEESFRFQEKICDLMIKEILESYEYYPQYFNHTIKSSVFKIVFDYRLTDHPLFKEDSVEVSFVGKWVYDEFNLYESGESFYSVDYALEVAKIFLQKDEYELGSQTYEEVFNVYDDQELKNITALKAEDSDAEESAKIAGGILRLYIKEDFFNTFFDVIIKAGVTEFKVTKQVLEILLDFNKAVGEEHALKLEDPIEDISLTYKLDKFRHSFHPGGVKHDIRFKIKYNGLNAVYDVQNEIKVLYRNEKLAFDVSKFKITKKADENYPKLLTTESIKKFFDYQIDNLKQFFSTGKFDEHVTQFRFEDKYFVFALKE